MFSVLDLMQVHEAVGVPIVFDYHHHKFCTGGLSEAEALKLACSTWGGVRPVVHYSESRGIEQGLEKETPAHSDLCYGPIHLHGQEVDVMIEAKFKELSIETLEVLE
jgi:UV DNA damage endonuclease